MKVLELVRCPECGAGKYNPCTRPAGSLGRTPVPWFHLDRRMALLELR